MARIERQPSWSFMKVPGNANPVINDQAETAGPQSFEHAFENNWPAIYRYLLRMVGDPAEAEDLALETFYRLYRRGDKADPNFNTATWLRRVALNLGLQSIRSFRRRFGREVQAGTLDAEHKQDGGPIQILTEREEHESARATLALLQPRQAQILLMRYSGASYREIAQALHLSPTSIGPLLLRAEREFARQFRALSEEDS